MKEFRFLRILVHVRIELLVEDMLNLDPSDDTRISKPSMDSLPPIISVPLQEESCQLHSVFIEALQDFKHSLDIYEPILDFSRVIAKEFMSSQLLDPFDI